MVKAHVIIGHRKQEVLTPGLTLYDCLAPRLIVTPSLRNRRLRPFFPSLPPEYTEVA